jgi:acyl carrier protein
MESLERLEDDIKKLIIDTLALEDLTPADIDPTQPLFVEGLGLDSIDALEIGIALEREYKIKMEGDDEQNRQRYASIRSLASWVSEMRPR